MHRHQDAIIQDLKMKKTSCKKLREFMNEEKRTSKDYKNRGFKFQGKQEAQHSKFFSKKLKGCK